MIVGWWCDNCKCNVSVDHFTKTTCGVTLYHPDYLSIVLIERNRQRDIKGVRVTGALGCPRSGAIERYEDVYVDPKDFNSAITGTVWGAALTENAVDKEIEVRGTLDGVEVIGHIDRLRRRSNGQLLVEENKHRNEFSAKYTTEAKVAHVVQLSLYAELYRQMTGERISTGIVWYHFSSKPVFKAFKVELWSVDRCLDWHPQDGAYTVRELLHQLDDLEQTGDWRSLPLAGKSQRFGTKDFCDYCSVQTICMEAETGCPF